MYVYETIHYEKNVPVKVFISSIRHSSFHWHSEYELIFVLKGSLMIIDEDISRELIAGDFYLINTKSLHSIIETDNANICLIVQLSDLFVKESDNQSIDYHFYLDSQNPSVLPKCGSDHFIRQIAKLGIESLINKSSTSHRIMQLLHGLIADVYEYCVYDTCVSGLSSVTGKDILERVLNYIQSHYQNPNVIYDVCKVEGLSEKSLYNLLRQNINMTPSQFLMTIRLEHAKYLLSCTQKSLSFIADDSCLGSESTFFRAFKQKFGMTPLQYRKLGNKFEENHKLQDYLSCNTVEAQQLLIHYASLNNHCKKD